MNVTVNDQGKALHFYTSVLGFTVKHDIPMGAARWLTVVSPEVPGGPELLLEPMGHARPTRRGGACLAVGLAG